MTFFNVKIMFYEKVYKQEDNGNFISEDWK